MGNNRMETEHTFAPSTAAEKRNFIAYAVAVENLALEAAPQNRQWMEETSNHFANRCLPLLMANQAGWFVLSRHEIELNWNGGSSRESLAINCIGGEGACPAASHFGYGIITWSMPFLFRTPPDFDLLVRGPSNCPKDGIYALEGLVETNWAVATFTMNWKVTRPNHPIRFRIDEPIAMLVPQRRRDLESFQGVILPLNADRAAHDGYKAWSASRVDFNQSLTQAPVKQPRSSRWEKHYFKGTSPGGTSAEGHHVKLSLSPFRRGYANDIHRNVPLASLPRPDMSCFVCSMPRSGSFLLSEALETTGIAGRPQEYFTSLSQWRERLDAENDSYGEFLRKVLEFGTTANGIFAAKTHWYQFSDLLGHLAPMLQVEPAAVADFLPRVFGRMRYVQIVRNDKLRQAISYARAVQSDVWWKIEGIERAAKGPPAFDRKQVDFHLEEIRRHETAWEEFFGAWRIRPHVVVYEELAADYEETVRGMLDFLEIALPGDFTLPPPRLQKQADEETEGWVRRYLKR
jgi:LPS sulfotransferase NodH